jgi:chitosanase
MQQLQDAFYARHYLEPAANDAAAIGIKSVLGAAVVADSRVQGGFQRIRDATIQKLNGTPSTGVSEKLWIETYLQLRRAWKESLPAPIPSTVYREDTFLSLVSDGNWDLVPPLTIRGIGIK